MPSNTGGEQLDEDYAPHMYNNQQKQLDELEHDKQQQIVIRLASQLESEVSTLRDTEDSVLLSELHLALSEYVTSVTDR